MDLTVDADRTTLLSDHRKQDPAVEDDELSDFHAKLGERGQPVVQEATNCRSAFVKAPGRPPVEDRIGSEEAHYRVDVTLIHSLEGKARKLNQVGCPGLLGHRRGKYRAS
jgi:hypothetical protein